MGKHLKEKESELKLNSEGIFEYLETDNSKEEEMEKWVVADVFGYKGHPGKAHL